MKNNPMEEATEMIKQATIIGDPSLFIIALNKISLQMPLTLRPLNQVNLPFVAAILERYTNALKTDLNAEQREAFEATIDLIKDQTEEYALRFPVIKGGK